MKKLLLSILVISSFTSNAQILTQDFESATFPPTGWTRDATVATRPWSATTTISPALQDDFLISGTNSAFINWIGQDNDANLISPSFSLVNYSQATFNFKAVVGYSYMIDLDFGNLFAKVSIDGGATWSQVWVEEDSPEFIDDGDMDEATDLYNDNTVDVSIDLTPYVGEADVKVKFEYVANDADGVSVDDVVITGTLGINDALASSFKTFPNPVNDIITISNTTNILLSDVRVTDINGRTVKTINANNVSEIQINVTDLSAGVYFLNINSDAGTAVKRIVKN